MVGVQNGSRRRVGRVLAVAGATATVAMGIPGVAGADVPPRTPSVMGDDIVQLDNFGPCNGAIHVDFETNPARPGNLTVLLTPRGTFGATHACATTIQADWLNGTAPFAHVATARVDTGPARLDLPTGSGISLVTISSHQRALAVSSYTLVP